MKYVYVILYLWISVSCESLIKNKDVKIEDEVTLSSDTSVDDMVKLLDSAKKVTSKEDLIGNWVGWFLKENHEENRYTDDKNVYVDEGFSWGRENKICLTIYKIADGKVYGRSVVAGNNRSFQGEFIEEQEFFKITAKEPGDNKYDGSFQIEIRKNTDQLNGTWSAFHNIEIPKRVYTLTKKVFVYNPNQMLSKEDHKRYIDWEKKSKSKKYYNDLSEEEADFEENISSEFVSATDKIYEINASTMLLKTSDVENLMKGDLFIIRNMIYARHGYSFHNRPLRVFFDAQDWYIPMHTNIKSDLSDIEKKNIQLLLRYEKNAKEYYDYFGRG